MTWLPPILRAFEVAYPDIETSIHATDAVIDLQRSDHDLALRARYLLRPGGGGDTVSTLPLDLVATPAIARAAPTFAAARSRPIPLIGFSVRESSESVVGLRRDGRMVSIPAATRIWVNNGLLARELARAGFGAALVMRAIVADDLAQGRLTRVLPQYSFGGVAVRLLQRDAQPSAAARAFIGFVRERTGQPPTARLQ
jgi:DNA-binding transcriptional LysR family regulator